MLIQGTDGSLKIPTIEQAKRHREQVDYIRWQSLLARASSEILDRSPGTIFLRSDELMFAAQLQKEIEASGWETRLEPESGVIRYSEGTKAGEKNAA